MNHKFNNTPSLGWLCARFRKHFEQRATFRLTKDFTQRRFLEKSGFNLDEPIFARGIFCGIFKRNPRSTGCFDRVRPVECEPSFEFRDVIFFQGDKQTFFPATRKYNKTFRIGFWLKEIHGNRAITNQEGLSQVQGLLQFSEPNVSF